MVTETVVHSDGLDVDKVIELQKNGKELGIGVAFGVGTSKLSRLCQSLADFRLSALTNGMLLFSQPSKTS